MTGFVVQAHIYQTFWKNNNNNIYIYNTMYIHSEGSSCDTVDWSNDAENSALNTGLNYILKYI